MNAFLRKLSWLARRRRKEDDLREEIEFHLSEEASERAAEGLSPRQARRAAERDLGNVTLVKEDTRAAWGWTILEQLGQDLRYAIRTIAANRIFSALAILSLALGIGANTAIYSLMDSIMMRSLPVADPGSLVILTWRANSAVGEKSVVLGISGSTYDEPDGGISAGIFPFQAFELFQKNDSVFSSVFGHYQAWFARSLNVTINGQANLAAGRFVTGDFFRGLGVPPAAGRLIIADDDRVGAPPVAVVSHAFSQKRLGGAANAVGESILVNNIPFTVVGVTPPGFFGVDPASAPDLYFPMRSTATLGSTTQFGFQADRYLDPNDYWIEVMARLRPGVSLAQAQATLAPQFQQWVATTADSDGQRANLPALVLQPGAGGLDTLRRKYSKPLLVLMILVALILALACANVANLLLARAAARRREMALRLSLGAGRPRIIRQLLTESVLMASMGGALGLLFAIQGIGFLTGLLANGRTNSNLHAGLNWRVLAAAAALSLVTGILFGLAPALQSTRVDVMTAMKEQRAGSARAWRSFWRMGTSHALVAGQIAISLLVLVAAGLFVRTLSNLHSIDVGFNRENMLLFLLDARKAGHKDPEISAFYADLRERFGAIPGVRNASLSDSSLIEAGNGLPITVGGAPPDPDTRFLSVGPEYFKTMGIPILEGRDVEERDQPGSQPVAIINEVFAKTNFTGRNPVGQHIALRAEGHPVRDMEIVGVSKNTRYGGLREQYRPIVYIAYNQGFPRPDDMVFELRTAGDPLLYANSVREIVRQADPRLPVSDVRSQTAEIDQDLSQEITLARLCSAFAILALIIACVGIYGAVSYNVAGRTSEIGIRMALGAARGRVVWMVLRELLMLAAVGLAISVPTALATSKFVDSFLFGMQHNDPWSLWAAVTTLLTAALLAGYFPARRASRVDPMIALRHE